MALGQREFAGVGFIIAPEARRSIISYLQCSSRIAAIKVKVEGGGVALVSAYAPPNTKPHDERQQFYTELGDVTNKLSVHGPKILLGDFNARLQCQQPGEEDIIGPGTFGRDGAVVDNDQSNRGLFIELCTRLQLCAANTLQAARPEYLVTYRDLGTKVDDPISYPAYAQLDYILVPVGWCGSVWGMLGELWSTACIASLLAHSDPDHKGHQGFAE